MAFGLQPSLLFAVIDGSNAKRDLTLRIENPVPGKLVQLGQCMKNPNDPACGTGSPGQGRDLPVGGDFPGGDAFYNFDHVT